MIGIKTYKKPSCR